MATTNNSEILNKAIQMAIDGGYIPIDVPNFEPNYFKIKRPTHINAWPWYLVRWTDKETGVDTEVNIEHVIFSHDFAKALWPRSYMPVMGKDMHYDWEMHLQKMVIADDPIKYLGETL